MKGIVFTEFLELVELKFGLETVNEIIEDSDLKSKGVYTAIGTYDFSEMLSLISNLSAKTNITIHDLLYVYGLHFFKVLKDNYPSIINKYKSPIDMLASIDSHIHVEVRKIYPDAELPKFEVEVKENKSITLVYTSSRSMYAFALGLIEKTFHHFNSNAKVNYSLLQEDGSKVKFVINENE
mgnify:CR=1 FL=1